MDQRSPGRRPRIGYVLKVYPRFSETFIVTEILAREAAGADIEIFSLRQSTDSRFHDQLARVQAPVTYIDRVRRAGDVWQELAAAAPALDRLPGMLPELLAADAEDAIQAVALARTVVERGIEHLHAHFGSLATTVARLAAGLAGVPYSFTAHAKDIYHESVEPADLKRKLADAHHVITVSDFNLAHLHWTFGTAAGRVHRVYNGLELERFGFTAPADRFRAPGPPVIAAVGRLVEKKGFDVLIDAVRILLDAGRKVRVCIAGGGMLEAELAAQIERLGLGGVIDLVGPQPQHAVRELVAGADVLAAPCRVAADGNQDGLPTVLLESMALGTPCVSTPVSGIEEAVRQEETGLLVPEADAAALAQAISRLLDDPALADRLAHDARDLIEAEFDVRRQAALLDELLIGRQPPVASVDTAAGLALPGVPA